MTNLVFNNFVRGKLDKDLSGRFDLPVFSNGFHHLKNFICNYKGNLKYRTGFEYLCQTKENNTAKLFQFRFNTDQAYLVVATGGFFRFYTYDKDGKLGAIQSLDSVNDIPEMTSNSTDGYECSASYDNQYSYVLLNGASGEHPHRFVGNWANYWFQIKYPTPYFLGKYKIQADNLGQPEYPQSWEVQASNDGVEWTKLALEKDQEFKLNEEKTYYVVSQVPYTYYRLKFIKGKMSGGSGELRKLTFYGNAELGDMFELESGLDIDVLNNAKFAQNADVMYITEQRIKPKRLVRKGAVLFEIADAEATGINYEEDGYPSSTTFYKGRLYFGGFSEKPTTIKASKVADYSNFTIPTTNIKDDDALSLTLTDISDPIEWLYGGKRNLIVGNAEGISIVNGGTADTPITSTKVNADLANREGVSNATPTEKDSQMLYVGLDKTRVYNFDYDLVSESFISSDMNLLANKLGKIEEIYYKRDANDLVYCRTENGQMLALLYNKAENIIGWFPIDTNGRVESMCTVTRPDGKDDLFICVLRNGNYYIERLGDEVEFTDFYDTDHRNDENMERYHRIQLEELKCCSYLDNSVRYEDYHGDTITLNENVVTSNTDVFTPSMVGHKIVYKTKTGEEHGAMKIISYVNKKRVNVEVLSEDVYPLTYDSWYVTFNTVGDLDDLEGVEQSVVADGGYVGDYKVTSGLIVLDRDYTVITIGYKYDGFAKSFNLGVWANGVNYQTLKKRISQFIVRFVDSAGFSIGTSLDNLQNVQKFNPQGFYDSCPLLINGDEYIYGYNDNHNKEKSLYFVQSSPLPCCLTMVDYSINFERLD